MTDAQRIANTPWFGTGQRFRDLKAAEADCLDHLPDPSSIAPIMAASNLDNWMICGFGNSNADGRDWYLTTDGVRASALIDAGFPADAKTDAIATAAILNAYRLGLLVRKETPPLSATLPSDLSRREARAILVAIIDQHGTSISPRRCRLAGARSRGSAAWANRF